MVPIRSFRAAACMSAALVLPGISGFSRVGGTTESALAEADAQPLAAPSATHHGADAEPGAEQLVGSAARTARFDVSARNGPPSGPYGTLRARITAVGPAYGHSQFGPCGTLMIHPDELGGTLSEGGTL